MKLGLHLIKNPSGTYSFVGSVPAELAYNNLESLPREEFIEALRRDTMLPGKYRRYKEKSYSSAVAALMIARDLGYTVNNENEVLNEN